MAKNKRAKPVRTVPVGRNAVQRQRLTPGLRNTTIDGAPVTYAQWKRGDLLRALTAKPTKRAPGGATAPGATRTLIRPPAGSYDPNLDVQERAAKRGYRYTTEDLTRGSEREATDFGIGQENLGRQRVDVQRQYGENLSDLLKARARGSEDYQSNLQSIARNFSQLGNAQAQRGREAGLEGGYALQAARKRAANEAITRAPVDTGYRRFSADSTLDETRLGQAQQRSFDEIDRSGGQLAESHRRAVEDSSVTGERAGTELQNYVQDIAAARQDQYRGPLQWTDPRAGVKAGLRNTRIGKKRKQPTYAQWKRGDMLTALVGKAKAKHLMATRGRV
jgi:hypothetical protein